MYIYVNKNKYVCMCDVSVAAECSVKIDGFKEATSVTWHIKWAMSHMWMRHAHRYARDIHICHFACALLHLAWMQHWRLRNSTWQLWWPVTSYEWLMSHTSIRMNDSCHTSYKRLMSHTWIRMNDSCHTSYERLMSHTWVVWRIWCVFHRRIPRWISKDPTRQLNHRAPHMYEQVTFMNMCHLTHMMCISQVNAALKIEGLDEATSVTVTSSADGTPAPILSGSLSRTYTHILARSLAFSLSLFHSCSVSPSFSLPTLRLSSAGLSLSYTHIRFLSLVRSLALSLARRIARSLFPCVSHRALSVSLSLLLLALSLAHCTTRSLSCCHSLYLSRVLSSSFSVFRVCNLFQSRPPSANTLYSPHPPLPPPRF